MASRRGKSIKQDLIGLGIGLTFIALFWVAWKTGLVTAASSAFAQWFVHVILSQ